MTDTNNPILESNSEPNEIKHTDTENNEHSYYDKVAPDNMLFENSTQKPTENVESLATEEPTNGYNVNEKKEEKGDPPSPPSEKEALTSTDRSTEKTEDITDRVNTTTKKRKFVENPFVAIIPIVLNLLHVLFREQLQKLLNNKADNPYETFLSEKPVYIDRASADKHINVCINGINYLLLEGQQIALIDDPMRTFKYIIIFYVSWCIMSWMSFQSFIITALILGFTLPKAYQCNKTTIDEKLDHILKIVYEYWERFAAIAKHHTKDYADKVTPLIAKTGLIPNNNKTSEKVTKEE
ncbi:20584_t:CDS:2 [Dentiscutata erythropus]|uniref:Reticulon-like protein n=1 Tax=Dentiscutata erythropus TaxID=1348616 RepID=A0A9N9BLK7_9GLOM|nr:20584_t:CDS:2 [Dentiscutata erythropus]